MKSLALLSMLIALLVSAFSVTGASAARTVPAKELEDTWERQLERLRLHGLFYDTVRLYPADFEDLDDLAQAHFYLEKFGIALRAANSLIVTHPGFDFEGNVTNQLQATQTVRSMADYLWVMRGMHKKLVEMDAISEQNKLR
jgi:hypothetical protein